MNGHKNTVFISQDISVVHDRNPTHTSLSKKGDMGFIGFMELENTGSRPPGTHTVSSGWTLFLAFPSHFSSHVQLRFSLCPHSPLSRQLLGFLYFCLAPLLEKEDFPTSISKLGSHDHPWPNHWGQGNRILGPARPGSCAHLSPRVGMGLHQVLRGAVIEGTLH